VDNPLRITDVGVDRDYVTPTQDGQNDRANIHYNLSEDATVTIKIYDEEGSLVRTLLDAQSQPTGEHKVTWRGEDDEGKPVPDGTYTYRINGIDATGNPAEEKTGTIKVVNQPIVVIPPSPAPSSPVRLPLKPKPPPISPATIRWYSGTGPRTPGKGTSARIPTPSRAGLFLGAIGL
jgi:hypothetical protein